jgi:hypothetical protein
MLKKLFILFSIFSFSILTPFGAQKNEDPASEENKEKPSGILNDIEVININIDGEIKNIAFFEIPKDINEDPENVKVFLSLENNTIDSIYPKKDKFAFIFNKKEYVSLEIVFTNGEIRNYLLSNDSVIHCKDALINIPMSVKISALKMLKLNKKELR